MSEEVLVMVALVVGVALALAYVLVRIQNSRPALGRRLELFLVLSQLILVLAKCAVDCDANEGRQTNFAATLDALRLTLDALPTDWRLTPWPWPTMTSLPTTQGGP